MSAAISLWQLRQRLLWRSRLARSWHSEHSASNLACAMETGPGMMSFSMLAARATEPHDNAIHARTSALASIQVYRHDMYDAGGDEDEKQRYVQGVPRPETLLEDAQLGHFPGRPQAPRNVVEGNALESVFLRGDRRVS